MKFKLLLLAAVAYRLSLCATVPSGAIPATDGGIGDAMKRIFHVKTVRNHTDVRVPAYMYQLYDDPANRQYDMVKSVTPKKESLGAYTQFVYDLSEPEPTEILQKAVLQYEPDPKYKHGKELNVSFWSVAKRGGPKKHLGSASMYSTVDLFETLGSDFLTGIDQLIVQAKVPKSVHIGLVLYSAHSAVFPSGHELSAFLFETANQQRYRRSVLDNEIDADLVVEEDAVTQKPKQQPKPKQQRKKKNKVSRVSKLQAVEEGDKITFYPVDQCHMEKLVLNFADIGWEDWVIYPKSFETNYCTGGCLFPLGKESRPTNHATVQSLARSFGRLWDVPEPSCAPGKLAPLTLLYMDHNNEVVLKSYPDMKVTSCSCK